MKCRKCGYVSFDDLESCKNCGFSFDADEEKGEEGQEDVLLQDELFSLPPEEEAVASPPPVDEEDAPAPGLEALTLESTDGQEEEKQETGLFLEEETIAPVDTATADGVPEEVEEQAEAIPDEIVLPKLEIDFDPVAAADEKAAPPGESVPFEDEEILPGEGDDDQAPIIDDESALPEDLWVEEGAGFIPRLGAFAIDGGIILSVLGLFFLGALAVLGSFRHGWSHVWSPVGIGALFVPFYLLGLFVSLCYYTFFVGWAGRTPGKAVMGLDIQRTDGGEMTYTRAFLRWVGYLVSITFAGFGFLWIAIDERKRGWHDYLSGTWVKNLREEPPDER